MAEEFSRRSPLLTARWRADLGMLASITVNEIAAADTVLEIEQLMSDFFEIDLTGNA